MEVRGARTAKSPWTSSATIFDGGRALYCVGLGLVVPPTPLRIDKPVYNRASGSWTLELPPGSPRIAATTIWRRLVNPFSHARMAMSPRSRRRGIWRQRYATRVGMSGARRVRCAAGSSARPTKYADRRVGARRRHRHLRPLRRRPWRVACGLHRWRGRAGAASRGKMRSKIAAATSTARARSSRRVDGALARRRPNARQRTRARLLEAASTL